MKYVIVLLAVCLFAVDCEAGNCRGRNRERTGIFQALRNLRGARVERSIVQETVQVPQIREYTVEETIMVPQTIERVVQEEIMVPQQTETLRTVRERNLWPLERFIRNRRTQMSSRQLPTVTRSRTLSCPGCE